MQDYLVYLFIVGGSFVLCFALTPIVRWTALRLGLLDYPDETLKTHTTPTPRLGGVAIFLSILAVLFATRFLTHYPSGTIRNFRYILLGATAIFTLGLVDDTLAGGVRYKWKFLFQFLAAAVLLLAPIRIHFLNPAYVAVFFSLIWVACVANSINLIDISDGLAGTQTAIAAASFLAIGFPSEDVYVNILASCILGATLGFLPHNFRRTNKMFMGDSGSLTLGYLLAVLAIGSSYSTYNSYAVFAPILIIAVPVFETIFLIYIRVRQGLSPFKGSRDHIAHRLQALGLSQKKIVVVLGAATFVFSSLAFWITQIQDERFALAIYALLIICLLLIGRSLTQLKMSNSQEIP